MIHALCASVEALRQDSEMIMKLKHPLTAKKSILRLVAFDMDGTLLDGRVIYVAGQKFGFISEVERLVEVCKVPYERSRQVAKLLKGRTVAEFAGVVESIPLMKGAVEAVRQLKEGNCKVGIISDSYTLATEILACKLKMDFHVANRLEVQKGVFTGRVEMPLGWENVGCDCSQSVCKRYHLINEAKKYGVRVSETGAVGDSSSDRCMLENAGVGVLFNPLEDIVMKNVNCVVRSKDLNLVLTCLKERNPPYASGFFRD
jgi:phosphoserine phosphatase